MKKHFSSLKLLLNSLNSLFLSATGVVALLPLLAGLASCRNELLEPPDFSDRGAYSSTDISAPEVVVATQGGFRSITVSWSPVANAVKYEVYTTKIATDTFERRTETNGNDKISVVIKEDADVLAYFKVKAYDKNGNASEFSKMCHGTTLGVPIITNIIQDELGKSATVRWWCGTHFSASTYKNDVKYSIALYADAEGATKIAEQEMEGVAIKMTDDVSDGEFSAECTFTGLSPKTTYYYQVKAYLKDTPDKVEASAIVDKETARRLIPNPVEELSATQGISDKEVTLSFILPDFVDVKESSDVFLKKPLYFEISRAEVEYTASEEIDEKTGRPVYTEGKKPLTDYAVIATIRAAASSEWNTGSDSTYYFDCTSDGNNTSSKKLTLEKTDGVESNEGDAEPYIPGYKLTFTDTTARRGDDRPPAYSYKISSYADIEKKVTSDESVAKATGWLIGNLNLDLSAKKVVYDYTDDTKKQISKITVKFSCTFEDYGKGYTYIVTQSAIDLEGKPIVDEAIVKSMDISELKDFSVVYDLSKDKEGYYSYKFYIAPNGTANYADAYYCYDKYRTKTPVVNSRDKLLEIEKFEVEDGYKDKFVIKWSYNPDFTYELSWTPVVDSVDQESKSIALAQSNENNEESVGVIKSIGNGMATFEHEAESGDVRKYTIQITSGFGIPNEFEQPSYTLGTAFVEQVGYAYDTITVKWDKVQKADSYALDAWYEDGVDALATNIDNIIGETSYTFTPDKSDDARIAGKKVKVCITARNAKDSTRSEVIPTRLIGPAEVDAKVNAEAAENYISVSWSEVKGANGYLIRRVMYNDTAMTSVANDSGNDLVVTYYYDASSKKIALTNDGDVTGRATVSPIGAGFTLTDEYMKSDAASDFADYQKAQAKISWGLPFRYIVLPVLEKDDFDFIRAFECEGKVEYKNLSPSDATATWGYGLNLVADKATSGTEQNIKWDEPYNAQRDVSTVKPVVYYRAAERSKDKSETSKDKFYKFTGQHNVVKGAKTGALQINSKDYYDAFEYIVKYCSESELYYPDEIDLPPSLSEEIEASKLGYDTPAGHYEEQNNKGYLLTLNGFEAQVYDDKNYPDKKYYEKIYWLAWEYSKRAVGPDSMTISVKNHNIGDYFHDIVTVEKAYVTNSDSIKVLDDEDNDIKNDVTAEREGSEKDGYKHNAVLIAPSSIVNDGKGTTDGYLKVLRDYKHYYTFTLKRDEINPVKYEDYVGKENSVKDAYRQITDEEMVRAATLAMTIGFKHAWDDRPYTKGTVNDKWSAAQDAGSYTESGLGSGTVTYEAFGGAVKDVYHNVVYKNYKPEMTAKSGEKVTFLTIDAQDKNSLFGETWGWYEIHAPTEYHTLGKEYGSNTQYYITITGPSDTKELYSAKLAFFWLGPEKEPRYTSKEGYKGIKISYPNGSPEKVFGNITALPFQSDGSAGAGFKQDAAEWQ